jgi:hypothetical protein
MPKHDYAPPVSRLLDLGDVRGQVHWPDYEALGLGPQHVPDLIRMALDEALHWADEDNDAVSAPVHAWRAPAALSQAEAHVAAEAITLLEWAIEETERRPAATLDAIRARRSFNPAAASAPDSTSLLH